ncbi:MAG TPA: hypothetical protein VFG58_07400 [Solirubrobacterales bacterium]|nr:hypothetical protein [Solirubrobacterales bacterium]
MPRLVPFRPVAACALAFVLVLSFAATAAAKRPVAQLRVLGAGGRLLAERPLGLAGQVSVKTSPGATCFGAGTGGSGRVAQVRGATPLGMLLRGSRRIGALRPVAVTDAFSFGLGLCDVGGSRATKKLSWLLKVDHRTPSVGGDAAKVKPGDEVLWALAPYPYPDELVLRSRHHANPGVPFGVQVLAYDEKGHRKPAAGVRVSGASDLTGADGRTTVTLRAPQRLIARGAGVLPSNRVPVCVGRKCPRG